ncbi:hypothetical protein ACS96_28020 [Pseudomonas aeruginosa]|nr:hypothetical protein ACS96_28020 [Pseudomonas aeruginosa]
MPLSKAEPSPLLLPLMANTTRIRRSRSRRFHSQALLGGRMTAAAAAESSIERIRAMYSLITWAGS